MLFLRGVFFGRSLFREDAVALCFEVVVTYGFFWVEICCRSFVLVVFGRKGGVLMSNLRECLRVDWGSGGIVVLVGAGLEVMAIAIAIAMTRGLLHLSYFLSLLIHQSLTEAALAHFPSFFGGETGFKPRNSFSQAAFAAPVRRVGG